MMTNAMLDSHWTFIDLFAGIGGFHLALERLGGKCVFASEWDKGSQKTYLKNFGILPEGDIRNISEKSIPGHDVLCAGFPCQAFSISGKQLGFSDMRGNLFFDIVRIVKECSPKVVFLENVKNFVRHDKGKTFSIVKKTMETLGYTFFFQVLKSSYYGVPQARERVYFVCFRNDLEIHDFDFSQKAMLPIAVKNILEDKVEEEYFIHRDDISFYKDELDIRCKYSPCQIGKINKGGQGERIYSIHSSGITLSAYGGGVASKTGGYLIDGRIRKLTPRECLRMQGFPESFVLTESKNISYRQLGNSVSVPVIESIMKKIISANSDTFRSFSENIQFTQQMSLF